MEEDNMSDCDEDKVVEVDPNPDGNTIIRVGGTKITFGVGGVSVILENTTARDVAVVSNGNVFAVSRKDGSITAQTGGKVFLQRDGVASLISPSLESSEKELKIGDVLKQGSHKGWQIYGFEGDCVKLLEPADTALRHTVTMAEAEAHVKALVAQGHAITTIPSEREWSAIFNNLVKGGHNEIARLEIPNGNNGTAADDKLYWQRQPQSADNSGLAFVRNISGNFSRVASATYTLALTRCVQAIMRRDMSM